MDDIIVRSLISNLTDVLDQKVVIELEDKKGMRLNKDRVTILVGTLSFFRVSKATATCITLGFKHQDPFGFDLEDYYVGVSLVKKGD